MWVQARRQARGSERVAPGLDRLAKSGDDLVKVMQLARSAALAFGGDTGQAFETINYAIGNLAPRALKHLATPFQML